jgi:hypothetical protein
MSTSNNESDELSALNSEVADDLSDEYYFKVVKFLEQAGLSEMHDSDPVPLEAWSGVAQALADVSGYRVTLQTTITESVETDHQTYRIIGHREVANADPSLFVK